MRDPVCRVLERQDPIRQALVAIGGRARRLLGVDVRVSKSFLPCGGTTLLDWCLRSLADAGIDRVVLAHHDDEQRQLALRQLGDRPHGLHVTFFRDEGAGVHGIPFQALDVLDPAFLFEAGHGVSAPGHHRKLLLAKRPGNVVASAFRPAVGNDRFEVVVPAPNGGRDRWALAQPMVVDRQWARTVAGSGYDVNAAAAQYHALGRLAFVESELPVEFDTWGEHRRVVNRLEANLGPVSHGRPWAPAAGAEPSTVVFRRATILA